MDVFRHVFQKILSQIFEKAWSTFECFVSPAFSDYGRLGVGVKFENQREFLWPTHTSPAGPIILPEKEGERWGKGPSHVENFGGFALKIIYKNRNQWILYVKILRRWKILHWKSFVLCHDRYLWFYVEFVPKNSNSILRKMSEKSVTVRPLRNRDFGLALGKPFTPFRKQRFLRNFSFLS